MRRAGRVAGARPYVVVLRDGAAPPQTVTDRLERGAGFRAAHRYAAALRGFAARLSDRQLKVVQADPAVAYAAPDLEIRATGTQALAPGETVPVGIRRIGAVLGTGAAATARAGGGPAIAVLDSGVDLASRDLDVVSGTNCIKPGTPAADDNGHGTHVAGIAAARNNGAGLVGVSPGTRVVSVKVLNSKNVGTLSQFLCGIDWVTANAAAHGIAVANMSLAAGGTDDGACGSRNNDAMHRAICRSTAAGVTYVAAAANNKTDLAKTIPAAYASVLTVTAMTDTDGAPGGAGARSCSKTELDDRHGTYSNYAVSARDAARVVAAPGTCVVSLKPGGGTATYIGTSQAAPHAAGVVAECLGSGACAGLTPAEIVARVRADAMAAATTANGFNGDPLRPVSGRAYGPLVRADVLP